MRFSTILKTSLGSICTSVLFLAGTLIGSAVIDPTSAVAAAMIKGSLLGIGLGFSGVLGCFIRHECYRCTQGQGVLERNALIAPSQLDESQVALQYMTSVELANSSTVVPATSSTLSTSRAYRPV